MPSPVSGTTGTRLESLGAHPRRRELLDDAGACRGLRHWEIRQHVLLVGFFFSLDDGHLWVEQKLKKWVVLPST